MERRARAAAVRPDSESEERRPRQDGAPIQGVSSNNSTVDGTTGAWWSMPPHLISAEQLDAVSWRID